MNTEKSMLLKPLFIGGMFNREGKRQRFIFIKELAYADKVYELYRSANKSDERTYPNAENDKYCLYVPVNGWLCPLNCTEFYLETRAEYRGISQLEIITNYFNRELKAYELYRDGLGGYPSFIGAAMINDLTHCKELSLKRIAEDEERRAKARAEEAERERKEKEAKQAAFNAQLDMAENAMKNGGVIIGGDTICGLADRWSVNIPLKTRGWILDKFAEARYKPDGSVTVYYYKSANGKGSNKIYEILDNIRFCVNLCTE